MWKCQLCTTMTAEYLVAQYTERHGKPSEEKIEEIALDAAKICVAEADVRGWKKEVNED